MTAIEVRQQAILHGYDFRYKETLCAHESVTVEKACCSAYSDIIECGCGGTDQIICDNPECTGMSDAESEAIFEQLEGGGAYCE
jgi:hypothetical protein